MILMTIVTKKLPLSSQSRNAPLFVEYLAVQAGVGVLYKIFRLFIRTDN